MEEIKRLHRAAAWEILPDRYSTLKRLLISIRSVNVSMTDDQKSALQSAILNFSEIERKVERALALKTDLPKVDKLNTVVSLQLDKISEVLGTIKQEIGVEKDARP